MGRRERRRSGSVALSIQNQETERDSHIINLINELVVKGDIVQLRKVSAVKGLVDTRLRARIWPRLLGLSPELHTLQTYAQLYDLPHKDFSVVEADMARSLWSYTTDWPDERRNEQRSALRRILEATIAGNSTGIYYYQGLHDIAAVLLFICGEALAYKMLDTLAHGHLSHCTQPSLDAATESLSLLYPILQAADPELHSYIISLKEPSLEVPYFALSWHMTWFAHDVPKLDDIARLFDLFLSSHPLMPLYVAAVAIRDFRREVFACEREGPLVYATLKSMKILGPGQLTADDLAQQAAALYQQAKPLDLQRRMPKKAVVKSTGMYAYLKDGVWRVPSNRPRRLRNNVNRVTAFAALASLSGAMALGAALLLSEEFNPVIQWNSGSFEGRFVKRLLPTLTSLQLSWDEKNEPELYTNEY